MSNINRRLFLHDAAITSVAGSALLAKASAARGAAPKRKMTIDLRWQSIGVKADQRQAIELAHKYGFESVAPDPAYLVKLSDEQLRDLLQSLKSKGLVFGAAGLPVDFRKDQAHFDSGIKALPKVAAALQRAGVTRAGTWIAPSHNQLTYRQNFQRHKERLRQVASILDNHGIRFGLEYVGPKTSWTGLKFPFIHTMIETKELIAEIGCSNVGFVLDSWHWYTAGETVDDLLTLKNRDIVAVDLNDAPAGIPVDKQMDLKRELPASTGVIAVAAFLNTLAKIGYDGPVRAEPFNKKLNQLQTNDRKVAATAKAMKKAFALIK